MSTSKEKIIIWDITKPIFFLPGEVKKIYTKNFIFYYKKFNLWINKISKDNSSNIGWWFSRPASRDERLSNLYKNICIIKSLKELDKLKINLKIISNSSELGKIAKSYKLKNIEIIQKNQNISLRIFIFIKEIILLITSIILSKILFNYDYLNYQENNLIDFFKFEKKGSLKKLFGNFLQGTHNNFIFVPTFLNFSFKNFFKFRKKKNYLIKEYFLNFFDLILIIKNLFFKSIILNHKLLNKDFNKFILEEFKIENNIRSIITAYVNYFFFKRLKIKGVNLNNIISWHENQIVDKGWSLGVKKYFINANYFGYQASTLHPQFFNLSQTHSEIFSGVAPNKLILIGKKYKFNRTLFFKKISFNYTKNHRFKLEKSKTKKNYILFLLTGIKEVDEVLILIFKYIRNLGYKNVKIKFHPILKSKYMGENFKEEINGNGSNIINLSKIIITTSYTSGLYESLARNCNTIMVNTNPLDYMLFKDLKKYSKKIIFLDKLCQLSLIIDKCLKQKIETKDNKKIKNYFFNK